jgi:hypothetical protein
MVAAPSKIDPEIVNANHHSKSLMYTASFIAVVMPRNVPKIATAIPATRSAQFGNFWLILLYALGWDLAPL